jgi:hypothetical protein
MTVSMIFFWKQQILNIQIYRTFVTIFLVWEVIVSKFFASVFLWYLPTPFVRGLFIHLFHYLYILYSDKVCITKPLHCKFYL